MLQKTFYFDGLIKLLSDLYLAKFLDFSVNRFCVRHNFCIFYLK